MMKSIPSSFPPVITNIVVNYDSDRGDYAEVVTTSPIAPAASAELYTYTTSRDPGTPSEYVWIVRNLDSLRGLHVREGYAQPPAVPTGPSKDVTPKVFADIEDGDLQELVQEISDRQLYDPRMLGALVQELGWEPQAVVERLEVEKRDLERQVRNLAKQLETQYEDLEAAEKKADALYREKQKRYTEERTMEVSETIDYFGREWEIGKKTVLKPHPAVSTHIPGATYSIDWTTVAPVQSVTVEPNSGPVRVRYNKRGL